MCSLHPVRLGVSSCVLVIRRGLEAVACIEHRVHTAIGGCYSKSF